MVKKLEEVFIDDFLGPSLSWSKESVESVAEEAMFGLVN